MRFDVYLPGGWGGYRCAFTAETWEGVFAGLGGYARCIWLVRPAGWGIVRVYARRQEAR